MTARRRRTTWVERPAVAFRRGVLLGLSALPVFAVAVLWGWAMWGDR